MRTLNLGPFQFQTQDVRVVGTELDGGTSLSGISEPVQIDGGGYWQADFSNGAFGGRQDDRRSLTLAWRAINAGLSGGQQASVLFNDRHHQPITSGGSLVPHSDDTPFSDGSEYLSGGASATVLAVNNGQTAGLNATSIDIAITSDRPLIGGERFTHVHPVWGDRAYEIYDIQTVVGGLRIKFQPPIRGGIAVGDALDFDNVRCTMRRSSAPTNALAIGLFSSASITMVEDMRNPA